MNCPSRRIRFSVDVPYGSGEVVTGWHYDFSDRQRPKFQHCYYSLNVDKTRAVRYMIAFNGMPQPSSPLAKADFDGAFGNCIWFSGS